MLKLLIAYTRPACVLLTWCASACAVVPTYTAGDVIRCYSLRIDDGGPLPGVFRDIVLLDSVRVNPNDATYGSLRYLRNIAVDSAGVRRIIRRAPRGVMQLPDGAGSFPPEPAWFSVAPDSVVMFDNYGFGAFEVRLRLSSDPVHGMFMESTDAIDLANPPRWRSVSGKRVACF